MTLAFLPGLDPSPIRVESIDSAESSRLLTDWAHNLGPCNRPFGQDHWLLLVDGKPLSLAVSASIVSPHVIDDDAHGSRVWQRKEVVELARLCTVPTARWATRVMLRLWREVLSMKWVHWPPRLLTSYSQNDRHGGRIYRFDGWRQVRRNAGSSGGGTWSTKRSDGHVASGSKTLWVRDVEVAHDGVV